MATGHMEVGELPDGSGSILQSKEVLESMSRKELQALAKERGITANSKSAVIIKKILEQHPNVGDSSETELSEDELREIKESEVHSTFLKKFEELQVEHERVIATMAETLAKYAGAATRRLPTKSWCTVYEGIEEHMTSTIHQMFKNAVNMLSPPPVPRIKRKAARKKKAKVAPPEPPAKVSVKTAVRYVPICVKGVPKTVANNELQTVFNTEALVGRFESGHCKVLVPESELGRALSQNSVSGHKIRVKRWRVRDPDHHRNGCRHGHRRNNGRNLEVPTRTVETCMNSMGKTIGTRMKSIEMAMCDMKRVLKRIASTEEAKIAK
jgi:hypothetical protein